MIIFKTISDRRMVNRRASRKTSMPNKLEAQRKNETTKLVSQFIEKIAHKLTEMKMTPKGRSINDHSNDHYYTDHFYTDHFYTDHFININQ